MSILTASRQEATTPISLSGSDVVKTIITIEDLLKIDNDDLIARWYELNRASVWKGGQSRLLVSSIFEGIDIPKIYFHVEDLSIRDGIENCLDIQEISKLILDNIFENSSKIKIMDGLQRTTSILEFATDKIRTLDGLTVEGEKIGKLKFTELSEKFQDKYLDYPLDVVFYFGPAESAVAYFHRLNSGTPLSKTEYTNAYNTAICEWVRTKANVAYPKDDKFEVFHCDPEGKSKLLGLKGGNRMLFDEILKQCIAYSLGTAGVLDISSTRGNNLDRLSKQTWTDLTEVPYQTDKTFNLVGEVEGIFTMIDLICKGPKPQSRVGKSLVIDLYMLLHTLVKTNLNFTLVDSIKFSKEFFHAHQRLMASTDVRDNRNNTFQMIERGGTFTELRIRLKAIVKELDGKDIGITI